MRLNNFRYLNPLRDVQDDPIIGYCDRCGGEMYRSDEAECGLCYYCQKEMEDNENETEED